MEDTKNPLQRRLPSKNLSPERLLPAIACTLFAGLAALAGPAWAQGSAAPVRLVVPYAPGGGSDSIARIVAPKLSEVLGATVVVENRSGASGMIGAQYVARATADGNTILIGSSGESATNSAMVKSMAYDPIKDFVPIVWLTTNPIILVAGKGSPYNSFADVRADANKKPDGIAFGSPGVGSPNHLAGELLHLTTDMNLVHVAYRGSGPATTDVIAGQVPLAFLSLPSAMPQIRSGNLLPIAVATKSRVPMAPDVPTIAESGVADFEVSQWNMALVPTGTPPATVTHLNTAFNKVLADPDVRTKLNEQGALVVGGTAAEAAAFVKSEAEKYGEVARKAGIVLF